jgi:transcriptional regulator GlxA family with amidase domain
MTAECTHTELWSAGGITIESRRCDYGSEKWTDRLHGESFGVLLPIVGAYRLKTGRVLQLVDRGCGTFRRPGEEVLGFGITRAHASTAVYVDVDRFDAVDGADWPSGERLVDGLDTLVVSGGFGHDAAADDARLVDCVRRLAGDARRVASVCTGATVLAAAGLLDGRPATTHWEFAPGLAERFPKVRVDAGPIYIRDGKVATSAGVTASLDLTLAFIDEDHGPELARRAALGMVTYLKRPGNQAQMSLFTTTPRPQDRLVRGVLDHVMAHPDGDLRIAVLAATAGVSVRHLTRLFHEQVGEPPGQFVRRVRLEVAARMLASTGLPLPQIARASGFSSAETLRQAFVASCHITPSLFRSTQSTAAPRPPNVPE